MVKSEDKTGLILFLGWAFFLTGFVIVAGYNGLYGMDSHEYFRYCHRILDWMKTGVDPGNFFWPVNYPFLGACLAFITGPQPAMQLLSIMSSAWIVYLIFMLLIREFPGRERETLIYVVLFMGASPFFFRYSISIMSDITAQSFACTAFYMLYLNLKSQNEKALYLAPVLISLSIFTRFAMLPLLIPAVVYVFYLMIKSFRPILFFLSCTTAIIPVALYVAFKGEAAGTIFHHEWVSEWSIMNYFRNSFETIDGYSHYLLPNIIYVFTFLLHPGFIFMGIVFLIVLFFKKYKPKLYWPLMIIAIACYILFLAGMPTRNDRFLIVLMPFYLVICFPAYLSLLAYFHGRKNTLRVFTFGAFLIQSVLLYRAFLPFLKLNRTEHQLSEKVSAYHPPMLYTFGMEGALRSYGYKGTVVPMWPQKLDSVTSGSMVLFNSAANEVQWKGKSPMINFHLLKDSAGAVLRENLENGWEIYEIKKAYPAADTGLSRR